ncbi:MAG: 1,4-dihydroxy-6-naphthoate synthase [Leptospiraceae bacterium]|nr:1,4-dihydroxy-6-naphthoate synthase [Leptospiraceae bacterium]
MSNLSLAISPCPNDTFIFYHLLNVHDAGLQFKPVFLDVSELNQQAMHGQLHDVTKLSFFAMTQLQEQYTLLDAGGALGHNCGPLLLSRTDADPLEAFGRAKRIAIPGKYTTAHLLLRLYLDALHIDARRIEFTEKRYDLIMPALKSGEFDLGLIIHEERFTYRQQGLHALLDLGEWWENATGHPIPLGCIAARKQFDSSLLETITKRIRASITFAKEHPDEALPFIRQYSQSLETDVVQAHIALYVNDYSLGYGVGGHAAINELFERARHIRLG